MAPLGEAQPVTRHAGPLFHNNSNHSSNTDAGYTITPEWVCLHNAEDIFSDISNAVSYSYPD
jgi:hypothetical protein